MMEPWGNSVDLTLGTRVRRHMTRVAHLRVRAGVVNSDHRPRKRPGFIVSRWGMVVPGAAGVCTRLHDDGTTVLVGAANRTQAAIWAMSQIQPKSDKVVYPETSEVQ